MTVDTFPTRVAFLYGVGWRFMARLVLQMFEPVIQPVGSRLFKVAVLSGYMS